MSKPSDAYIKHFQARVIQDAYAEATAAYWKRRAIQFEAARHRPDDHPGRADVDQLRDQWRDLTDIAQACRAHARIWGEAT